MKRTSALLGGLGVVGVVFPLASFVMTRFFGPFIEGRWVWINLGLGVLLLVAALVVDLGGVRARLVTGAGRPFSRGGGAMLSTALLIFILWGGAYGVAQHPLRFDWSEIKTNTLSVQTLRILDELDSDVEVMAFYRSGAKLPGLRELLDRYGNANPHLRVEFIDPNLRPDLVEKYGLARTQLAMGGLIRVVRGAQVETIAGLLDVETRSVSDKRPALGEEQLSNALYRLTHRSEKVAYVLEGHGERAAEGEDADAGTGFAKAVAALRAEGFRVERALLLATGTVPEDADLLLIPGPTRPFNEEERAALQAFANRGGGLLVMLDPRAQTNLGEFLGAWGIEVGDDIVVDQTQSVSGRPVTPIASLYGDHVVTRDLGRATVFHVVRSVAFDKTAAGKFMEIIFTSEDSWAERDLANFFNNGKIERGEGDLKGPVPIAVAGTLPLAPAVANADGPARNARLIVVGDADFASNQLLDLLENRIFFLNAARWLTEDSEAIAIRPPQPRASRFRPSQVAMNRIRFLALFSVPECIALLGVLVWWRRARTG